MFFEKLLSCLAAIGGQKDSPKNIQRWGEEWGAEVVREALSQRKLRERARRRFPLAADWFWETETLEMASHPRLAEHHASKFEPGMPVLDLCAGAGIDLCALQARGPATGYEIDENRYLLLKENFSRPGRPWPLPRSSASLGPPARPGLGCVELGDGLLAARENPEMSFFADPARRHAGGRVAGLANGIPSPTELAELAVGRPRVAMKLWPGAQPEEILALGAKRVEYISFENECREALAIFGSEIETGVFAVRLRSDGADELSGPVAQLPSSVAQAWIGELDVAAARLQYAPRKASHRLGETHGYVTGDRFESVWVRQEFEVLHDLPFDRKQVRTILSQSGEVLDAVKVAPTLKFDPPAVERELCRGLNGSRNLVLILYPWNRGVRAALCRRPLAIAKS